LISENSIKVIHKRVTLFLFDKQTQITVRRFPFCRNSPHPESYLPPQVEEDMITAQTLLKNLRRPKILIRAARLGMHDYRRDRDLKRIARTTTLPPPTRAVEKLIWAEHVLEKSRKDGEASYDAHRHIRVLTALLAEARLLPAKARIEV
jgi:uncharacterized protein DUF6477